MVKRKHLQMSESKDFSDLTRTRVLLYLNNPAESITEVSEYVKFLDDPEPLVQFDAALVLAKATKKHSKKIDKKLRHIFEEQFSCETSFQRLLLFGLQSPHKIPRLLATQRLKTMISDELGHGLINEIVDSGVISKLFSFVCGDCEGLQIQAEAALALIEFTCHAIYSSRTDVLYQHDAPRVLVKLLGFPRHDVRDEAVHMLAKFVATCKTTAERDPFLLQLDAVNILLNQCEKEGISADFLTCASLMLSRIYRLVPLPKSPEERVVRFLFKCIESPPKGSLATTMVPEYAWSTLSCLSRDTLDYVRPILGKEFFDILVEIFRKPDVEMHGSVATTMEHALCVVTNIVKKDNELFESQNFKESHILPVVGNILKRCMMDASCWYQREKRMQETACLIIELCCTNVKNGVQYVIQKKKRSDAVIDRVVKLIQNVKDDALKAPLDKDELKFRAANAIKMAITHGNVDQIRALMNMQCIEALCDLLVCRADKIIRICLEGLKILCNAKHDDIRRACADRIMNCGGYLKIKSLGETHSTAKSLAKQVLNVLATPAGSDPETSKHCG